MAEEYDDIQPAPSDLAPSQMVTVHLGGKAMQVTPEVAEALYTEQRTRYTQTERAVADLQDLVARTQTPQQPARTDAGDPDLAFLQAPTRQIEALLDQREEKLRQYLVEQERKQKFQEELRSFRRGIFRAHPDLSEVSGLVDYVMNEKFQEVAPLQYTISERDAGKSRAQQIIAEATYAMLGRSPSGQREQRTVLPNMDARTTRPNTVGGRTQRQTPDEPAPRTVSDFIKKRQAERRNAARRGAMATPSA